MTRIICADCGRACHAERTEERGTGFCGCGLLPRAALARAHFGEEPCISGTKGSGTVFFCGCSLGCVFCQNYEISQLGNGKEITVERLAEIFLEQQQRNVENINLVTPTSYVPQIIEALKLAKERGLKLPIVYNTNGYENVETIKMLNGYIDIYLPDLKYSDNELAVRLSNAPKYFEIATDAIKEMYNQVGVPIFNEDGIMQKGIMIRHLVLPNNIENSKKVLKWISEELPKEVYVSVMAQYFPTYKAKDNVYGINRKLYNEEWKEIQREISNLGIENGFIQELGEHEEEYVPKWDY